MLELAASLPRLADNLPKEAGLTLADKRTLVNQAKVLIEQVYAHIYLKKALYAIDPVQRLSLLQYRLENPSDLVVNSELEFHRELLAIFTSLHDLHTNYVLPAPYNALTAVLPFLVEEYFDDQQQAHYLITKISSVATVTDSFKAGVELILWNGLPIQEAIRLNGEQSGGSNPAARYAVGLRSLTIRPLAINLPPLEHRIYLQYKTAEGSLHELALEWLVLKQMGGLATDLGLTASPDELLPLPQRPSDIYRDFLMGNQLEGDYINQARKKLFVEFRRPTRRNSTRRADSTEVKSLLPDINARAVNTPSGSFAYLRLFSFMVQDDQAFLEEIIRLLKLLPSNGLILDVRGNSGGLITAAERLLQIFTPQRIEPEKAQFISTSLIRELCIRNSPSPIAPQINLKAWVPSLKQAPVTGTLYSTAHAITTEEEANNIGQRYTGPVVLITDAHCYSATDMFAAGFRDHKIGKILGASDNTGAGGANVWQHLVLRVLAEAPGRAENNTLTKAFTELPRMADFRVSSRRMLRSGEQAGLPLEDFGVEPDERHYMTRTDLLNENQDLIHHAAKLLLTQARYPLTVKLDTNQCALQVSSEGIDRVDWYLDDRPAGSVEVRNNAVTLQLPKTSTERLLRLEGFAKDTKVATTQIKLKCNS
ncbi:Peptidase family S41 [Thiothrix eikelboomii]|uniref:Peptidase family S41 n=1 Tax=Thiothrix eikelboomii TaxID=92487 RepID=A0A1T4W939_9GAMM|nr:S41 family peptidase [Thiothrix eikelboomii]SKA73824.1 Peptidase family S41 [Thiothrix eikelboomii]